MKSFVVLIPRVEVVLDIAAGTGEPGFDHCNYVNRWQSGYYRPSGRHA
ncbi:MAG: hypothetical protein IPI77_21765 [Saprospiraceae bacterium]|nr:hypothetical protein [Saprospiraceae bacterium]